MLPVVLTAFLIAAIAPGISRIAGRCTGGLLAAAPLALFVWFLAQIETVRSGQAIQQSLPWAPQLGARLSLHLDGLSLLFALLITGIGGLILLYAGTYLKDHPARGRFFGWLLAFQGAMLGLVLADNVISLVVFWELTSIASYFLIGFDHHREAARRAALQALLTTGIGGLALLAGLILMALAGGSWEISELVHRGEGLRDHPLYGPILLLVLLGCFTKSAQFPFHFWLPNAMEAPTPVSAYLHSSTMVKAGIYLLARLSPALGGTSLWFMILTGVGGITMLLGAYMAIRQTYLKRILAYSTISALGVLTLLLGLGAADSLTAPAATSQASSALAFHAAQAFVVFLVAHAFYKATLFLVAGSVAQQAGTADVARLGGLARAMPLTAAAALLAALSMAGFPPSFGFISKELLLQASLEQPAGNLITAAVMVGGTLFIVVSGLVAVGPFVSKRVEPPQAPREVPLGMWLGPVILGGAGLAFGLRPRWMAQSLLTPAATALLGTGEAVTIELSLWHGFNRLLVLSGLMLACGVGLYAIRVPVAHALSRFDGLHRFGPESWYHGSLAILLALARWQTTLLQNGQLRVYLRIVLLTALCLIGWALLRLAPWSAALAHRPDDLPRWLQEHFYLIMVAGLILLGAAGAVASQSRLSAIASLGVVGYGVALIYTFYGAPDLAMTQFVVETLTVLLFVFVLYYLPSFPRVSRVGHRIRDLLIASAAGGLMSLLVLVTLRSPVDEKISDFFIANSVDVGRGRNIVNVILVDFRALDTLGEITVLAIAALGVLALLKLRPTEEAPR